MGLLGWISSLFSGGSSSSSSSSSSKSTGSSSTSAGSARSNSARNKAVTGSSSTSSKSSSGKSSGTSSTGGSNWRNSASGSAISLGTATTEQKEDAVSKGASASNVGLPSNPLSNIANAALTGTASVLSSAASAANSAVSNVTGAVSDVVSTVSGAAASLGETARETAQQVADAGSHIAETAHSTLSDAVSTASTTLSNAASTAGAVASGALGAVSAAFTPTAPAEPARTINVPEASPLLTINSPSASLTPNLLNNSSAGGLTDATVTPKVDSIDRRGESNAAEALVTEYAATRYVPLYSNPDGSSQTWMDTLTGDEFSFAGADAATLAEYYAAQGNTELARRYSDVALAQTRYTGVLGTGEYYDALPALGTIFDNTGTINGNLVSKAIGQHVIDATPEPTAEWFAGVLTNSTPTDTAPSTSAGTYTLRNAAADTLSAGEASGGSSVVDEPYQTLVPTGTSSGSLMGTEYAARNAALGKYLVADNAGTVSIIRGAAANADSVAMSDESNICDKVVDSLNMSLANSIVNVADGWKNNNASTLLTGVAGVVGTGAIQVLAPVDLINVGNKLITGRGGDLEPTDWIFAGLDALAVAAGALSFGTGYAGIKGLAAAAKGIKYTSWAGQAIGIPAAVVWELNKGGKE